MSNIFLIKDLAGITNLSRHTIKYYLKLGLIEEVGRSPQTRFRYFNQSTVKRLKQIRRLRKQKRSIREIQEKLNKRVIAKTADTLKVYT